MENKKRTKRRASLVARLRISAQETAPGHRASKTLLMLSMTKYTPGPNPEFCGAVFSDWGPSKRMDASQP